MLQTQLVIGSITTGAGKLVNTWVLATIDSLPRDRVRQTGNTGGNFGFWATYCLPDGTLLHSLGKWTNNSHKRWEWFYDPVSDCVLQSNEDGAWTYHATGNDTGVLEPGNNSTDAQDI